MLNSQLSKLHLAVINNDAREVAHLLQTMNSYQIDKEGFTPLDLSRYLGHNQCSQVLSPGAFLTEPIYLKEKEKIKVLNIKDMKRKFDVNYTNSLLFETYDNFLETLRQCPLLIKLEKWYLPYDPYTHMFQKNLKNPHSPEMYIEWINSEIGYGLFNKEGLAADEFVGEYVGRIKTIDHPSQINDYCFKYPTKWNSKKHIVIDAIQEGNVTRFINHSNQPNLQPIWINDRSLLHLIFVTNQPIAAGAELTFNYGSQFWKNKK